MRPRDFSSAEVFLPSVVAGTSAAGSGRRRDRDGPALPGVRAPLAVLVVLAVLAWAAGCSPVFNWREVPVGDDLVALLPCKPDHAQRTLPLGDAAVSIDMAGCEAGGATFAVASLPGGDPAQAEARLAAWRASARNAWGAAEITESSWRLPRAAAVPAPMALDVNAAAGAGQAPQAQLRWFAYADGKGAITLYQATVLGRPSAAEAGAVFFEGLRLR